MKILHIIPSIHPRYGGPSKAIIEMTKHLKKQGIDCEIATTHFYNEKPLKSKYVKTHSFKSYLGEYKASPKLFYWLSKNIKKYDLIHIHSVFCFPTFIAARIAIKNKKPYIVRTIGQLYKWTLENRNKTIKKTYLKLLERKTLEKANRIHFTTEDEKNNIELKLNNKKSYILPLGTEPDKQITKKKFNELFPELKNKEIILFLSRIHPKKGLDILIPPLKEFLNNKRILVIAGGGKKEYIKKLKEIIKRNNLEKNIIFLGPVKGEKKSAIFQHSEFFILPSHTENFGISVIEAMNAKTPVLISENVGIANDIKKENAGIVFQLNEKSIEKPIKVAINEKKKIEKIKRNALKMIKEKYTWNKIAKEQIKIYRNIIK